MTFSWGRVGVALDGMAKGYLFFVRFPRCAASTVVITQACGRTSRDNGAISPG